MLGQYQTDTRAVPFLKAPASPDEPPQLRRETIAQHLFRVVNQQVSVNQPRQGKEEGLGRFCGLFWQRNPMRDERYSGSMKSAMKSWLELSFVRLLVHISFEPSGEKTGKTSAEGWSVMRVIGPGRILPSFSSYFISHRS